MLDRQLFLRPWLIPYRE